MSNKFIDKQKLKSRELKFLVWDGVGMSEPVRFGDTTIEWRDANGDIRQVWGSDFQFEGRVDLQYTGLRDRNGTEIYEGFILKTVPARTAPTTHRVVKWGDGAWYDGIGNLGRDWCEVYETVVGNVFENPELVQSQAATDSI